MSLPTFGPYQIVLPQCGHVVITSLQLEHLISDQHYVDVM